MKLYDTKCHRISLLSKHLSPTTKLNKLSFLSSNQKKSRYHFLKSNQNKFQMHVKQQDKKRKEKEKHQAYLLKLRQEAYEDLHAQLQRYNDEFITRMRYMENNHSYNSLSSSTDSSLCTSEDSIQHLVELFDAGSVKDYSQLIEYESFKNPPNYFECQGEYGDLW